MSTDPVSPEVARFLGEYIETVPHLEALLIVWESSAAWNAQGLSNRIYLGEDAALGVLQDLQRAGLLSSADSTQFRFDPAGAATHEMVQQVADTYQRNIARVATMIHNRSVSPAREFARAFDFKRNR